MTTADLLMVNDIDAILTGGYMDINPRPHYSDGTPAHTISLNHRMRQYNLAQGGFPNYRSASNSLEKCY